MWAMDDLFSVPLGYVDPDQPPAEGVALSSVPTDAYKYRDKWLALRNRKVVAVHDSERELYADPIVHDPGVTIFWAPDADVFAR
jgi:hypothetical protein